MVGDLCLVFHLHTVLCILGTAQTHRFLTQLKPARPQSCMVEDQFSLPPAFMWVCSWQMDFRMDFTPMAPLGCRPQYRSKTGCFPVPSRHSGNNIPHFSRMLTEWKSPAHHILSPWSWNYPKPISTSMEMHIRPASPPHPPLLPSSNSPPCYTLAPPNKNKTKKGPFSFTDTT